MKWFQTNKQKTNNNNNKKVRLLNYNPECELFYIIPVSLEIKQYKSPWSLTVKNAVSLFSDEPWPLKLQTIGFMFPSESQRCQREREGWPWASGHEEPTVIPERQRLSQDRWRAATLARCLSGVTVKLTLWPPGHAPLPTPLQNNPDVQAEWAFLGVLGIIVE